MTPPKSTAALAFLAVAAGVLHAGDARAAFDLASPSPVNADKLTFFDNGVTLTVSNPVTAYDGSGGVNTNDKALCVWLKNSSTVGNKGKRCNYTQGPSALGATLEGLTFTFDQSIRLRSFDFSMIANLVDGELVISGDGGQLVTSMMPGKTTRRTFTFKDGLTVKAHAPYFFEISGDHDLLSGAIRINHLRVETVPGPVPLFGAMAAFTWSRQLRRRLHP